MTVATSEVYTNKEIAEQKTNQIYFIEKSIKYIHDNFKQKLPLQLVSSIVFLNPQYFSRIFKKEVGVNESPRFHPFNHTVGLIK